MFREDPQLEFYPALSLLSRCGRYHAPNSASWPALRCLLPAHHLEINPLNLLGDLLPLIVFADAAFCCLPRGLANRLDSQSGIAGGPPSPRVAAPEGESCVVDGFPIFRNIAAQHAQPAPIASSRARDKPSRSDGRTNIMAFVSNSSRASPDTQSIILIRSPGVRPQRRE
jgi:hypothetical protein